MNYKLLLSQLYKFGITGIFGSIINYLIFYISLIFFKINYLIAGSIGFLVPIPIVFIINKNWTFKSNIDYKKGLAIYTITNIIVLIIHILAQIFAQEILGVPEKFTQLFGIFISAILNFILAKILVF
jgi:putative flippase GtrA